MNIFHLEIKWFLTCEDCTGKDHHIYFILSTEMIMMLLGKQTSAYGTVQSGRKDWYDIHDIQI